MHGKQNVYKTYTCINVLQLLQFINNNNWENLLFVFKKKPNFQIKETTGKKHRYGKTPKPKNINNRAVPVRDARTAKLAQWLTETDNHFLTGNRLTNKNK